MDIGIYLDIFVYIGDIYLYTFVYIGIKWVSKCKSVLNLYQIGITGNSWLGEALTDDPTHECLLLSNGRRSILLCNRNTHA